MSSEAEQVNALQQAIIERAQKLCDGHIEQGELTRNRIIEDAREKIRLMEQKELLVASLQAEREYQRQVQANELRIQAELDRNRWGLVQAVLDKVSRELALLQAQKKHYQSIFEQLLLHGVRAIGQPRLVASLNSSDLSQFGDGWQELVKKCCGREVEIKLSVEASGCSGGVKLVSEKGDVMIDNTFEGILARRSDALQRLIFERLFSTVANRGTLFDG
jgi:vacuolar-type H+-ATPase subunit E/Vma4